MPKEIKVIGIVGGAGPYAGIDLQQKILGQTCAEKDQDYLPVFTLSDPGRIPDRTAFLAGEIQENPAEAIYNQLRRLEAAGAQVAAIPCNTAHAAPIDHPVRARLAAAGSRLLFLHMIGEVRDFLARHHPHLTQVGLLATTGTVQVGVYQHMLEPAGISVLLPPAGRQSEVHRAIYDPQAGIKALGVRAVVAREILAWIGGELIRQGAEALILGCTEIPVVVPGPVLADRPVIDPTLILARALIREAAPSRLIPLPNSAS